MKLPLKNRKKKRSIFRSQNGSSITLVLFFASIAMITVLTYLFRQMAYAKPSLKSVSSLQALFNARSGIYRAFYHLIDSTVTDTFKTINTLDSTFGSLMFINDSTSTDSTIFTTEKPELDGKPVQYDLFPDDSLGICEVSLEPAGGKCKLLSIGKYHSVTHKVTAMLGCPVPALPDTVVIYHNTYKWVGNKPDGMVVASNEDIKISTPWYTSLTDRYQTDITETDSLLIDPPLIIQSNHDLKKIKSVVNGPLLIDGSPLPITWRDTGTIVVKGDLQFTGEVYVHGITLIASGEIKILDESKLERVNCFTPSRLFIGDESSFQGNALAMRSIAVYGKSTINEKSSLIAGSASSTSRRLSTADSLKFSMLLSEESVIDAVCIALGTPGSIKTDQETRITGILWAQHTICHRGKMKGLIYAKRVVDCDDPLQMSTKQPTNTTGTLPQDTLYNSITGEIEPLQDISTYHLPFFLGDLAIISWIEE